MTWIKLDDNFPDNPKVVLLSHGAFRLHVGAICYCARNLTDGVLSSQTVSKLSPTRRQHVLITELVEHMLWHEIDAGYWQIHDYLDWNPSRVDVEAKRAVARRNARKRWGDGDR